MKLYIMRHGETDWNKAKKLQGQSDIELNDFGRRLAYKTRDGLQEVPFDLVISSPLKRARETAEIVRGDRKIPLIEDKRIEEMCFGSYEGMCCKGEGFNIPDEEFKRFFVSPETYHAPEGGEEFAEFCNRIEEFLHELYKKEDYKDSTILISVHGAVLCAILKDIKQNPMNQFWKGGVHRNCAFSVVNVVDGKPQIEQENVVCYDDEVEDW